MQASRTGKPRHLLEIGATFLVAAAVGFVLGASAVGVVAFSIIGALLVVLGALGIGRGRRSG